MARNEMRIPVRDDSVLKALKRIERLLEMTLARGAEVADTLDDVRSNLQELNVDVDAAVNAINQGRQELQDALANAGVDEAARAEIMQLIDDQSTRIQVALNPAVPVDPNTPHVDNTLPDQLPSE